MTRYASMIAMSVLTLGVPLVGGNAFAQATAPQASPSIGTTTTGAVPAAPVGHRQPSAADVPPDDSVQGAKGAPRDPAAARGAHRDPPIDTKIPKICNGCG